MLVLFLILLSFFNVSVDTSVWESQFQEQLGKLNYPLSPTIKFLKHAYMSSAHYALKVIKRCKETASILSWHRPELCWESFLGSSLELLAIFTSEWRNTRISVWSWYLTVYKALVGRNIDENVLLKKMSSIKYCQLGSVCESCYNIVYVKMKQESLRLLSLVVRVLWTYKAQKWCKHLHIRFW